jgi:hypothetical protein
MSPVHRIEAAHSEVGIFWLIDDKLVADSISWRQADICGGFYNGKNDHAALWTAAPLDPFWAAFAFVQICDH